ncbi:hypothetical protein CKAH01_10742 [Colletotrichum kahawae]|uniref:Uncharacterized protein n=1 Tax=Colletotrichum kahawae TaxID=34407 RepID=A0AAD9XVJ9_COLKA|nr:hypothetical protein CKAH01_10742 [Colletotrichum kahawae]
MATSTVSNIGEDWAKIQQLIFKNKTYLDTLSSKGLFLFLIRVNLCDILDGGEGEHHMLLALAHNKEKMTELFQNSVAEDEIITSLKDSLINSQNLNENKSVLKVNSASTTIYLHLHGLLHPSAGEGVMHVPSKVFVTHDAGVPQTVFLSTNNLSKPVDMLEFCYAKHTTGQDNRKEDRKSTTNVFIVSLPDGTCPDINRTWISKA